MNDENRSHVPGYSTQENDGFYYHRTERKKMPNAPKPPKKRSNLRFFILFLDLILIFGAYQCVKHFKGSKNTKGNDSKGSTYKRMVLTKNKYRISMTFEKEIKYATLSFVLKRQDEGKFKITDKRPVTFYIQGTKHIIPYPGRILEEGTSKRIHIFFRKVPLQEFGKKIQIMASYSGALFKEKIKFDMKIP